MNTMVLLTILVSGDDIECSSPLRLVTLSVGVSEHPVYLWRAVTSLKL
jgi:hypothetical protein